MESLRFGAYPQLDPEVTDTFAATDDAIERRKKLLRDKYGWALTAPLSGTREEASRRAVKELTDPYDQELLLESVRQVSKAQAFAREEEYGEAGLAGRFGARAQQVGGAFADAGTAMTGAAADFRNWMQGRGRTVEEVQFKRQLEAAKQGEDPSLGKDAPLSLKAAAGMAGLAPDLSAGLLAGIAGGPYAMFAYWTARLFPERNEDYLAMGLDPSFAATAGAVTAAAESAIEMMNIDPTGTTKGAIAQPAKGVIRRGISEAIKKYGGKRLVSVMEKSPAIRVAISQSLDALERTGVEIAEEGMQRGVRDVGQYLAALTDEEIEGPVFSNIAPAMWQEMVDSAPAIFALGGSTGGGMAIGEAAQRRQEVKRAKIEKEIVEYADQGKVPSRRKRVEWGLPEEGWESRAQRKEGVQELAAEIRSEAAMQEQAKKMVEMPPEVAQEAGAMGQEAGVPITPSVKEAAVGAEGEVPAGKAVEPRKWDEPATAPGGMVDLSGTQTTKYGEVAVDVKSAKERGMVGDFLEDSAGRIGISVGAISKKASGLMERYLTSKGELPPEAFRAKVRKDGAVSRIQTELGFVLKDYDKAIVATYGGREITIEEQQQINSALRGEVPIDTLPETMRESVATMRSNIDALSRRLIEIGAVQGDMAVVVGGNLGAYVTRSYRAFDDPNWAKKVPAEVRNKAAALLRQEYPNKTESQIQGLIETILYEGKAAETPIAILGRSGLGAKDLSILTRRKDIPPEIRALLGEYTDPRHNYARSVTMVGSLIANHQFLTEVREVGMGTFFSMEPTISEYGELKTRIAADGNSALNPLDGLYTTPEVKGAFERATSGEQLPDWLRLYLSASGTVKAAKTIGSAMTHVRNTVGNVGFAVANGHWMVGKMGPAWKGTMTGLFKLKGEAWRGYYLRATELGLVRQDTRSGELRDHIQDASRADMDEFAYSAEQRRAHRVKYGLKTSAQAVARAYQAEDDVWKLYAWENEKARYRKAMPELSEREIEELTADIVRRTYPTYSLVPEGVRQLRRFPLTGTFVSFPAEVIRTTYHSIMQAKGELANPRTRAIGAQRVSGLAVMATATTGIAAAFRVLLGVSADDDRDLRNFLAPWQVNNQLLHLGKTPAGDFVFIDLSYSDPHNTIRTPLMAFMRGDDIKDGLWDSLKDVAEPFTGEEILFGKFAELWSNDGHRIYNPEDDVDKQASDIVSHAWEAFEPGTITSAKRIGMGLLGKKTETGRVYSASTEMLAALSGQRIQTLDVAQSLPFKVREFSRRKRTAEDILSSVLRNRGDVADGELISADERSEGRRRALYEGMMETTQAALRLNVNRKTVLSALREGGLSAVDSRRVLNGIYVPRKISDHYPSLRRAVVHEARQRSAGPIGQNSP